MLEIILWYVLPNIVLFGGLYFLGKGIEKLVWFIIENYDDIMLGNVNFLRKK